MALGVAFIWLLMGPTDIQSADRVRYLPAAKPQASIILEVDGASHSVRLLEATNVSVRIEAAEAQDLKIATAFELECQLRQDSQMLTVAAYADSKYHMIPIDIVSYKSYDPSYVKLQLDEIYLTNSVNVDFSIHKVRIDFYNRD